VLNAPVSSNPPQRISLLVRAVLHFVTLHTLTLAAASLAGRAMGPAIATAANNIMVRVVSCMVMFVGLYVWRVLLMVWLSVVVN